MPDRKRQKSVSLLQPTLASLTPITEPSSSGSRSPVALLKRRRPPVVSTNLTDVPSPTSPATDMQSPISATPVLRELRPKSSMDRLLSKTRPKPLPRGGRQSSLFGPFRSHSQHEDENNSTLRRSPSTQSSNYIHSDIISGIASGQVLLHGEIQTSSGMFKKRSQYLVLTDRDLIKFRSQSRAAEVFTAIPASLGRASGGRHSRLSSNGSAQEVQIPLDGIQVIPLNQIVASYRLDDGKTCMSVEICHLDEELMQASSTVLQLSDPREHDLWLSSIRAAAMKARLKTPLPFSQKLIEHTARILERDRDYDPNQLHIFRVVQKAGRSGASRSSSDDLTKVSSNICVLAIGLFKIHLIPLPRNQKSSSSASLVELGVTSLGIATLASFTVGDDDTFSLKFCVPLSKPVVLVLCSSCVNDIALSTRRSADFLRPLWPEQPFTWNVSRVMDEDFLPVAPIYEEYDALNRTLAAYCVSYGLNAAHIRYTISNDTDGGTEFRLVCRADEREYSTLDLLAVFRALRYNRSFSTISFAGVNLGALYRPRDVFGDDQLITMIVSGSRNHAQRQLVEPPLNLLIQEVQALAQSCSSLRCLDFSYCLPQASVLAKKSGHDTGCGICEAIFPLCARRNTRVDSINLNGINLSEVDIDYIFSAGIERTTQLRELKIGDCGLSDRGIHTILSALSHQKSSLESLDISGNIARLEPRTLEEDLGSFKYIRKLNLSNVSRISTAEPLLSSALLRQWSLEEICLSGTVQNGPSLEALADYLRSPSSHSLRHLDLARCQIDGKGAATVFHALPGASEAPRDMRIVLSENRLELKHEILMAVIEQGHCPTQIVMQMIDYQYEKHFQRLLNVIACNNRIVYLDLAKTQLPTDASQSTCEELSRMLRCNGALTYLDISGEHTHLNASSLGPGLNTALVALKDNTVLEILRLENQKLGLSGAKALATILEANTTLREIYCDGNEFELQAFTVLVNSLERNKTLLYMPDMHADRALAQGKLHNGMDAVRETSGLSASIGRGGHSKASATMKRTLGRTISSQRPSLHTHNSSGSNHNAPLGELQAAMESLHDAWDQEVARLNGYLGRNYNYLHSETEISDAGTEPDAAAGRQVLRQGTVTPPTLLDIERPGTSGSLEAAMRNFGLESAQRTPQAELDRQIGIPLESDKTSPADSTEIAPLEDDDSENEHDDIESPLEMQRRLE